MTRLVGALSVWSIIGWWSDSRLLLSDRGLYADGNVAELVDYPWRWSIFDVLDSVAAVRIVMIVGMIAGLVMVATGRARVRVGAAIVVFLTLASLTARAPFAVSSAEMYLTTLVFWAALIELSRGNRSAIAAMRLQVGMVYAIPVIIRMTQGGDSWIDGNAIRRVVDNEVAGAGIAAGVARSMPDFVLSLGTWAVLIVEILLSLLLALVAVAPQRVPAQWRRLGIRVGVALHVCIALVCGLWFFSAVAIAGLATVVTSDGVQRRSGVGAIAVALVSVVVVWNIQTISSAPAVTAGRRDNPVSHVTRGLGLTQVWSVFSPNPPRAATWVEIRRDGRLVIDTRDANDRIRKLAQNVAASSSSTLADAWLSSRCEEGNYVLIVVRSTGRESSPRRAERTTRTC